ncbi:MAG: protein kinase [Deltaproteobacteria bacterium]
MLAGRFRIEHLIGMGSMGVVLAARHIELDTRVAIKVIRPEMQALPAVVSRFAREAKAAVVIRSEHVAQVFDVGTDDELGPYIVMEHLEGRDLRAVLDLEGRVPLRRAVDYVLQACEALAAAHAKGVIHRDIKPENLFLARQGGLELIKLLDFGISKATLTGQLFGGELSTEESPCLMGTPLYMSPEQIHSIEHVDQRADIWSLGTVLYELVTGRSAYGSTDSLPALLKSILETAPAPLAECCSEAESALQGVIDLCLERNAARRFQNVAELAYALLPFASSRARRHAQRAASLIGARDATESSALATPAPLPPRPVSRQPVPPGSEPLRDTASGTRVRPPPAALMPERRSRRAVLFVSAALGVLAVAWLVARQSPGVHAERVAAVSVASPRLESGSDPASAEQPAPALPTSRTVLVESQPSGAVVKIEGQVIGITPLSTLLPPATVLLSLERPGYAEAQTLVQVEPAGRGAKPIHTRVVLKQAPREPAGARAASRASSPGVRLRKTNTSVLRDSTGKRSQRPRPRRVEDPPAGPFVQ